MILLRLTLLLVLLVRTDCFAQLGSPASLANLHQVFAVNNGTPEGYIVAENFEGTGLPAGWTNDITGSDINYDPDYTGTTLSGSQSLRIQQSDVDGNAMAVIIPFTQQTDVWVYFQMRVIGSYTDVSQTFAELVSADSDTDSADFRWQAADHSIFAAASQSGPDVLPDSVNAHVWIHYSAGVNAGPNGTFDIFVTTASNGVRPVSPAVSRVVTETYAVKKLRLQTQHSGGNGTSMDVIFDNVLIKTSEIGSSPWQPSPAWP